MPTAETSEQPAGHYRAAECQQGGQKRALGTEAVHGVLERESLKPFRFQNQTFCFSIPDVRHGRQFHIALFLPRNSIFGFGRGDSSPSVECLRQSWDPLFYT